MHRPSAAPGISSILPPRHCYENCKEDNMEESPYSRFDGNELILRDELAVDRTLLANERTLLAYLRAGISMLIAGVSMMHFSIQGWFWTIGIACVPTGVITCVIGVYRYWRMDRTISLLRKYSEGQRRIISEDTKQ
jgi:putative membrane protein